MSSISRREFLRLAAAAGLSAAFAPLLADTDPSAKLGRVAANYLRVRLRPSATAKHAGWKRADEVVNIYAEAADESGRRWFEIDKGYVAAADVQPVKQIFNRAATRIEPPGLIGELTIPFTDVRRKPEPAAPLAYRLYYGSTIWVRAVAYDSHSAAWYKLYDERLGTHFFALASALRLIPDSELQPINPNASQKKIIVNLTQQRLTAFEGKAEVFSALIAAGRLYQAANGSLVSWTPTGTFTIDRKRPSRHMGNGEAAGSDYELPGVPWVSYFHWRGFSFHGTYWHNDYGRPRSAGCINMLPEEARWIYRWSQPSPLPGQELTTGEGTRVEIVG